MSEKLKDYLDQFHSQDVFIPTKTITLTGEVDDSMYETAIKNLHGLDSVSGAITIKMKSGGGSVEVAKAIYDSIRVCKNHITIICYGEVSSSATLILQAADTRIMTPNSRLMIHVGSEGIARDHPRNVDKLYEQLRIDEKWMEDTYLRRIKEKKKRFTRQQMKNMLEWDRDIYPKEAIELGLCDSIGDNQ